MSSDVDGRLSPAEAEAATEQQLLVGGGAHASQGVEEPRSSAPATFPPAPDTLAAAQAAQYAQRASQPPGAPAISVVFVPRDYSLGEQCQFSRQLPPSLQDKLDESAFQSVVDDLNKIMAEAEELNSANFWESTLGFVTCFASYAFITTHYEKCLQRLRQRIVQANESVFRPAGLYLKDPALQGLLQLEIVIL